MPANIIGTTFIKALETVRTWTLQPAFSCPASTEITPLKPGKGTIFVSQSTNHLGDEEIPGTALYYPEHILHQKKLTINCSLDGMPEGSLVALVDLNKAAIRSAGR